MYKHKKTDTPVSANKHKKNWQHLFSQQGNPQVFLALFGLTSVFGMGTGITQIVIVTRKLLKCISTLKNT